MPFLSQPFNHEASFSTCSKPSTFNIPFSCQPSPFSLDCTTYDLPPFPPHVTSSPQPDIIPQVHYLDVLRPRHASLYHLELPKRWLNVSSLLKLVALIKRQSAFMRSWKEIPSLHPPLMFLADLATPFDCF